MKKNKISKLLLNELKNKTFLITGGAGSVGSYLTKKILEYPVKQVRVIDIDEHALFKLNRAVKDPRLRLLLGSIEDKERLFMAGNNVDVVIHAAAIKNIEISEYNPIQTIDTNVNGTVNMIKMVMNAKPKKFLNISTDKAVESSTLYGATKLLSEKIVSWAGIHLNPPTKFATARFGNVIETRGNVFEIWNEEKKGNKQLSITDPEMKRYFFHIEDATEFILNCLPKINNGEIFIPKMKLEKIGKLADSISKKQKIIGIRKGEKIQEELMTKAERKKAIETKEMWVIKQE
mgnify:FL=1|jgi:UDP-N-acetylglucosamine 4,6-dehydratase/5-epimerase